MINNIIFIMIVSSIVQVITSSTAFFVAKNLTPPEYGIWTSLLLIISYSPILCLGTLETLQKQYPYNIGKGDKIKATLIEANVLGSVIISSIIIFFLGIIYAVLSIKLKFETPSILVLIVVITAGINYLSGFYYYRFSAHQNFKFIGIIDGIRSFIRFIFLITFSRLWSLEGTVFGLFFVEITVCTISGILSNRLCGKIKPQYDYSEIWEIIKIGFPITIIWWTLIVQGTVDKLISISLLGKTATGYYGVGSAIISLIMLLPSSIGAVIYPRVNQKIGQQSELSEYYKLVVTPTRIISLVVSLFIGLIIMFSPFIYLRLLPKYKSGLSTAQILIIGCYFSSIMRTGANYLIANNRHKILFLYVNITLIVSIILNILFIKLGFKIEGLAMGASLSSALLSTLIWKSVFQCLGYTNGKQYLQIVYTYMPFLTIIILLSALYWINPYIFLSYNVGTLCTIMFISCVYLLLMWIIPGTKIYIKILLEYIKIYIYERCKFVHAYKRF